MNPRFPIDLSAYRSLSFSVGQRALTKDQLAQLKINISLLRDTIVFVTAFSNARGYGGHTGGAYDIVPEALIIDGFQRGTDLVCPGFYDEAGHRVVTQYVLAAVNGFIPFDALLQYREHASGLYGHPEIEAADWITHSSGRLGHSWGFVNGIAERDNRFVVMFGSDGSQMEGSNAESARYAVAHKLKVLLLIDDNNVTIESHPRGVKKEGLELEGYMPGFLVEKTLEGHGLAVEVVDGENTINLFEQISSVLHAGLGPVAMVSKRIMAPGIRGIEGTTAAHDAISVQVAIKYLEARGHHTAVDMLKQAKMISPSRIYLGSSMQREKNRAIFGNAVLELVDVMAQDEREKLLVVSNDLGESCGLASIGKKYPSLYRVAGPMERNNFLVAGGFGSLEGYQAIYGTFSAFLEMIISEITMNRLNNARVLAHFSHAGVDDMSDNTCHFGINNFFADNGLLEGNTTRLYFPADPHQMRAIVQRVFKDESMRFIFSTRSASPYILDNDGKAMFSSDAGYVFKPGKDEVIREGTEGYIVSYGGDMLYRTLDAVERLRKEGISLGLINKPCLNMIDESMMKRVGSSPIVIVIEGQSEKTGLGSIFGTELLKRGYSPRYMHFGVRKVGRGGMWHQLEYQGLDSEGLIKKIRHALHD